MPTTRALLDDLTDAGSFERLATAALRVADTAYESLVHSGVNARGSPIACPVDGFDVLGKPPIFVAHTIAALAELSRKWLHSVDGDVAKATRHKREVFGPAVRARLVLTTTREPSAGLVRALADACAAEAFEMDLWTQSRLADFLDRDPEGQWVRRRFLGVAQTRVSLSSLSELAACGPPWSPEFDPPDALSTRAFGERLATALSDGHGAVFLTAASGSGKTVLARQAWIQHARGGGTCVQLSEADVDACDALGECVHRSLLRSIPTLAPGEGAAVLSGPARAAPLLILIEDINRSGRPADALAKVVGWATRLASDSGSAPVVLLCPIWPQVIAALPDPARKFVAEHRLDVPSMNRAEAAEAARCQAEVRGAKLSPLELDILAERLGRDPLLIGLHDYTSLDGAASVARHVDFAIERCARQSGHPACELHEALRLLAAAMLTHRRLSPSWREAKAWAAEALEGFRILLHDEALFKIAAQPGSRVIFRHDRIRDELLLRALAAGADDGVFAEPFFAELVGQLVAREPGNRRLVGRAERLNPLALFTAYRSAAMASGACAPIVAAIKGWLGRPEAHGRSSRHLLWECQRALVGVEHPQVREVTPLFRQTNWMVQEANCLNGDMDAALWISANIAPGTTSRQTDTLFAHLTTRYLDKAIDYIETLLREANSSELRLRAALHIAGRVGDSRLMDALLSVWHHGPHDRPGFVADMLWAVGRCTPSHLGRVFTAWGELSDETHDGQSAAGEVAGGSLRFAFWRHGSEDALRAFLEFGRSTERTGNLVAFYIEGWDHPDAVEFCVRDVAGTLTRIEGGGGIYLQAQRLGSAWEADGVGGGRRLGPASVARLEALFGDGGETLAIRLWALRLWRKAARRSDLGAVQSIRADGPLGDEATVARISLRDPGAVRTFAAKMEASPHPSWWWQFTRNRWQPGLTPILDAHLARRRAAVIAGRKEDFADHMVADAMTCMDDRSIEEILEKHWDHLATSARYVQLALWAATSRTVLLADSAVRASARPERLFEHVDGHFGIKNRGQARLSELRRLRALQPYLGLIAPFPLSRIAEYCNELGWQEYRREAIDSHLPCDEQPPSLAGDRRSERLQAFVAEEDTRVRLGSWARQIVTHDGGSTLLLTQVDRWVRKVADLQALEVAATIAADVASRWDLATIAAWAGEASGEANAVVEDTAFAIRRRSLDFEAAP